MWDPTWAQLPANACSFAQFSHKDSVKRVSAYQTWVFLYPAFQFSIDLGRVTLKRQEKHRSTKKSSIPFLHQKTSLGPGRFHSQAHLVLLAEQRRHKISDCLWRQTFWPCPSLPSILSSESLFLSISLFNQQQGLLWFLSLGRSLQNH